MKRCFYVYYAHINYVYYALVMTCIFSNYCGVTVVEPAPGFRLAFSDDQRCATRRGICSLSELTQLHVACVGCANIFSGHGDTQKRQMG